VCICFVLALRCKFQGELSQHNQKGVFDIIKKGEIEALAIVFDDASIVFYVVSYSCI